MSVRFTTRRPGPPADVNVGHLTGDTTFPVAARTALANTLIGNSGQNTLDGGAGRDTVLVTGASGGVGSALVQLAGVRGARVVAIVGRGKEAQLADFGVTGVLFRDEGDQISSLRKQTGKDTVDVVADIVAGESVAGLMEMLSMIAGRSGRISIRGNQSALAM